MGVNQQMTLNLFLEVKYQSGMSSDEAGSEAFGGTSPNRSDVQPGMAGGPDSTVQ